MASLRNQAGRVATIIMSAFLTACGEAPVAPAGGLEDVQNEPMSANVAGDRSRWRTVASPTTNQLNSVWGSSAKDVWAVGDFGTVLHYDGKQWKSMPPFSTNDLARIWGSGKKDIWVTSARHGGGNYFLYHYDGSSWTTVLNAGNGGVWGTSARNVWAGGDAGALLRFDGTSWTPVANPATGAIDDFSGRGRNDIWAVGHAPTGVAAMHFDGQTWTAVPTPAVERLHSVWAEEGNRAWAVGYRFGASGNESVVFRFKRGTWSDFEHPVAPGWCCLNWLWGDDAESIWTVGQQGVVLHWNGKKWRSIPSSTTAGLRGMWGSDDDDIWAVGEGGTIVRGSRRN